MKLLGRNINGKRLVEEVRARLQARGVREDLQDAPLEDEAPVEPLGYLVQALEENVDPSQPPPTAVSSGRLRDLVRFAARGILEELFGRQRAFNVHVRDLAAQLSTEVATLRQRVSELERLAKPRGTRQVASQRRSARTQKEKPRQR